MMLINAKFLILSSHLLLLYDFQECWKKKKNRDFKLKALFRNSTVSCEGEMFEHQSCNQLLVASLLNHKDCLALKVDAKNEKQSCLKL